MYDFFISKKFLKSVKKLDKRYSATIWKSLDLLEKDPPPVGLNVEKLKTKEKLESCRLTQGFRVIFARHNHLSSIELLFVGNHEDAYDFARSYSSSNTKTSLLSVMATAGGVGSVAGATSGFLTIGASIATGLIALPTVAFFAKKYYDNRKRNSQIYVIKHSANEMIEYLKDTSLYK
jgi:mRNA-degrading endonuclease RelE of RelBE toxin-antitoxin system